MGQQYRLKRRQVVTNVTENGQATFDLSRGYDYESIHIRITANVNVTTAGTAVRALAPCQLLKRMELIADGKNTIASVPGWWLRLNTRRSNSGYQLPPTAATIATYAVEFNGILDQAMIDGVRPKDSNLRTAKMSLLQARFTFGALADLFTGSPAGTITAFQIELITVETVELPGADGKISDPLYLQKRSYQDISLPASNANAQVILPVGNALRGVTILATVNGEPSNSVINNVTLASGVDVRFNLPGPALQRLTSMDYEGIGIVSNYATWACSSSLPTGIYEVDLMRNGGNDVKVTDAWDLSKASEAKLILDVNGGAGYQITVVTQEFIA